MPITTDFEVFTSKYHNRTPYVVDPMDLPETARIIDNLNNEYDILYDEKEEIKEKYEKLYDEHLKMYQLKNASKMLLVHMAIEKELEDLEFHHDFIWEYRVRDYADCIENHILDIQEDDPMDLIDRKDRLINKFIK